VLEIQCVEDLMLTGNVHKFALQVLHSMNILAF